MGYASAMAWVLLADHRRSSPRVTFLALEYWVHYDDDEVEPSLPAARVQPASA